MTPIPTINIFGDVRTVHDLPIMDCRWTCARKRILIAAIDKGLLSEADAQSKYALSAAELESWRRGYDDKGLHGLKVKALRDRQ